MAYISQEKKAKIAAALKLVVPKDWKYTLAVRHHSTIVMTITQAPVDIIAEANEGNRKAAEWRGNEPHVIKGYFQLNDLRFDQAEWPQSGEVLEKIIAALNTDNFDKSDPMTDYYHVGHYVDLNIGRWDRHFVCTKQAEAVAA